MCTLVELDVPCHPGAPPHPRCAQAVGHMFLALLPLPNSNPSAFTDADCVRRRAGAATRAASQAAADDRAQAQGPGRAGLRAVGLGRAACRRERHSGVRPDVRPVPTQYGGVLVGLARPHDHRAVPGQRDGSGVVAAGAPAAQQHGRSAVWRRAAASAPAPSQYAPGGSGQLSAPRERPALWARSRCLGRSNGPLPQPPILRAVGCAGGPCCAATSTSCCAARCTRPRCAHPSPALAPRSRAPHPERERRAPQAHEWVQDGCYVVLMPKAAIKRSGLAPVTDPATELIQAATPPCNPSQPTLQP